MPLDLTEFNDVYNPSSNSNSDASTTVDPIDVGAMSDEANNVDISTFNEDTDAYKSGALMQSLVPHAHGMGESGYFEKTDMTNKQKIEAMQGLINTLKDPLKGAPVWDKWLLEQLPLYGDDSQKEYNERQNQIKKLQAKVDEGKLGMLAQERKMLAESKDNNIQGQKLGDFAGLKPTELGKEIEFQMRTKKVSPEIAQNIVRHEEAFIQAVADGRKNHELIAGIHGFTGDGEKTAAGIAVNSYIDMNWTAFDTVASTLISNARGITQLVAEPFALMGNDYAKRLAEFSGKPTKEERALAQSAIEYDKHRADVYIGKGGTSSDNTLQAVDSLAQNGARAIYHLALLLGMIKSVSGNSVGVQKELTELPMEQMKISLQHAGGFATYGMLTTPGPIKERFKVGVANGLMAGAPLASGVFGGYLKTLGASEGVARMTTVFINTLSNMAVSNFTNESYYKLAQDGFDRAVKEGDYKKGWMYASLNITPSLMMDLGFAANSRPIGTRNPLAMDKYYAKLEADTKAYYKILEQKAKELDYARAHRPAPEVQKVSLPPKPTIDPSKPTIAENKPSKTMQSDVVEKPKLSDVLFKIAYDNCIDRDGGIDIHKFERELRTWQNAVKGAHLIYVNGGKNASALSRYVAGRHIDVEKPTIPYEDYNKLDPISRMDDVVRRITKNDITSWKLKREIRDYEETTSDTSVRDDLEQIAKKRIEDFTDLDVDKISNHFNKMSYVLSGTYNVLATGVKNPDIYDIPLLEYRIGFNDSGKYGTSPWVIEPNNSMKELFHLLSSQVESYGGETHVENGRIKAFTFEHLEDQLNFEKVLNEIVQYFHEGNFSETPTKENPPPVGQDTIRHLKNIRKKYGMTNTYERAMDILRPDKATPKEASTTNTPQIELPLVPENALPVKVVDPESIANTKETPETKRANLVKQIEDVLENSQARAKQAFDDIMRKVNVDDINFSKIERYNIEEQRGDKDFAGELMKDFTPEEQRFYKLGREEFNDLGELEDAWKYLTGNDMNKYEGNYWHLLVDMEKLNERTGGAKAIDTEFTSLDQAGIMQHRAKNVDKDLYKLDSKESLRDYMNQKYKIIDFVNTKKAIQDWFAKPQVIDRMLMENDAEADSLRQLAKDIESKFTENGMTIDLYSPSVEMMKEKYMNVGMFDDILRGTKDGINAYKHLMKANEWLDGQASSNGLITDKKVMKQIVDAYSTMGDKNGISILGDESDKKAINGAQRVLKQTVNPSQAFQKMDNLDVRKVKHYGGNKQMFQDFIESEADMMGAPMQIVGEIDEMMKQVGAYSDNEKTNAKFREDVNNIFNNFTRKEILDKRNPSKHIKFARLILKANEKNNAVIQAYSDTFKRKMIPSNNREIKAQSVIDKFFMSSLKRMRYEALGEKVNNARIYADMLRNSGKTQYGDYWEKFVNEKIVRQESAIDSFLDLDKYEYKKKYSTMEFRKKLIKKDKLSEVEADKYMKLLQDRGLINDDKVNADFKINIKLRDWLKNVQAGRVYAHIKWNPAWMARTQWLSLFQTGARYGLYNTWVKSPLTLLFGKNKAELKAMVKKDPFFRIKRGESKSDIPTDGDELNQELQSFEDANKIDKEKSKVGKLAGRNEAILDMWSAVSASFEADKIGLKGRDKEIYISDSILRTQSVYAPTGRNFLLESDAYKVWAPHKAYADTALNNMAEHLGYQKMELKERFKFFARFTAQLGAITLLANYLRKKSLQAISGSNEELFSSLGAYISGRSGETLADGIQNNLISTDVGVPMLQSLSDAIMNARHNRRSYPETIAKYWDKFGWVTAGTRYIASGNMDYLRNKFIESSGLFTFSLDTGLHVTGKPGVRMAGQSQMAKIFDALLAYTNKQYTIRTMKVPVQSGNDYMMTLFGGRNQAPSVQKRFVQGNRRLFNWSDWLNVVENKKNKKSEGKTNFMSNILGL